MSRPVLKICTSCTTDASWDGESFFERVKDERKKRELKPFFKLREVRCLGGCDTPCNAQLKGDDKSKIDITWLHGEDDVGKLLDGAKRYAEADGKQSHESLKLPGRPG